VRTLPDATVGVSYTAPALKATGGVGTHSWKAVQWPAGANLRIDTATGIISGVPAHVGHYQLPVAVADWTGQEIRNVLTIQVNGARLRITASGANELPAGRVGKEYRAALSLSGHGAINWTVSKWPAQLGLRFDRNTGSITGIPAREGKYELTFTAVDSTGSSASRTFQLMIAPELRLTYPGR
jgi:large repetitive protein